MAGSLLAALASAVGWVVPRATAGVTATGAVAAPAGPWAVGPLAVADALWPAAVQAEDVAFVLENWRYLAGGVWLTVLLTLASVVVGFLLGFPAGVVEVYAPAPLRWPVRQFGVVLRGTPILVIFTFTFFVLPVAELVPLDRVAPVSGAFAPAVVGLGFRSAAYQGQIFRGALQSVSEGQMDAARSVGLSKLEAIYRVVVPQALRRSIPSFQNEFTIVLKDSSIAFAIGISELLARSFDLFVQDTTAVLEVFLVASAVYFVLTFATNRGLDRVEAAYAIPGGDNP